MASTVPPAMPPSTRSGTSRSMCEASRAIERALRLASHQFVRIAAIKSAPNTVTDSVLLNWAFTGSIEFRHYIVERLKKELIVLGSDSLEQPEFFIRKQLFVVHVLANHALDLPPGGTKFSRIIGWVGVL